MGSKKKKIGAAGRFGAGYGKPKERLISIEKLQRKKQKCLFCNGFVKRIANGIWVCLKCEKKFAGGTYLPETIKNK